MSLFHFTTAKLWADADSRGFLLATPLFVGVTTLPAPSVVWLSDQAAARRPKFFPFRRRVKDFHGWLFEGDIETRYAPWVDNTGMRLKVKLDLKDTTSWTDFASTNQLDRRLRRWYESNRPNRGFDPRNWRVHEGNLSTDFVVEVGTRVTRRNLISELNLSERLRAGLPAPFDSLLRAAERRWLAEPYDRYHANPYTPLIQGVWCVHDLADAVDAKRLLDKYFRSIPNARSPHQYQPWLDEYGPRAVSKGEWRDLWAGEWLGLGHEHPFRHKLFLTKEEALTECARRELLPDHAIVRLTPANLEDALVRNVGGGNPWGRSPPGHYG